MTDFPDMTPSLRIARLPLVRSIRARLAAAMAGVAARRQPPPVIAIGTDGVDMKLAERHWAPDDLQTLRAEVPATSSAGWLSALTGAAPVVHGAFGAVQRAQPGAPVVSVFAADAGPFAAGQTVFHDAAAMGYRPIVLTADFAALDGPWRRAAFAGAELREGPQLVAVTSALDAATDARLAGWERALQQAIAEPGPPAFVFSIIDLDLHMHRFGPDARVTAFLDRLDAFMRGLSHTAIGFAFADHGLVPTRHDSQLSEKVKAFCVRHGLAMAGAGRMRWFYGDAAADTAVASDLADLVPPHVRVCSRAEFFEEGPFLQRVGDLAMIAGGYTFLTNPSYRFDHGSFSDTECVVPFARWGGG